MKVVEQIRQAGLNNLWEFEKLILNFDGWIVWMWSMERKCKKNCINVIFRWSDCEEVEQDKIELLIIRLFLQFYYVPSTKTNSYHLHHSLNLLYAKPNNHILSTTLLLFTLLLTFIINSLIKWVLVWNKSAPAFLFLKCILIKGNSPSNRMFSQNGNLRVKSI